MATSSDILVIGGGVAGLCAAIAARRRGASVRLVESAPLALRGGNARHARNFRVVHTAPTLYTQGAYGADEFLTELSKINEGHFDAALAKSLIEDSKGLVSWLIGWGVRLQDPAVGLIPYSRRTAFLLGGGKAMINALYAAAARIGVIVSYDSEAVSLDSRDDGGWDAQIACGRNHERLSARAVIVAAGGPGADPAWLRDHYGAPAEQLCIRGGRYSDGRLMQMLIAAGARTVGDPTVCHSVAVDARGPRFDGGIVTRITAIPVGLVIDRDAETIVVEGAGGGPSHYARWGARLARCPGGLAFLVLDAVGMSRADVFALTPISADTLSALAAVLELDGRRFANAIEAHNHSGAAIATPPYFAIPMRSGVTFVHFGLAVDSEMRVAMRDGRTVETLFAAGLIMAANVLRQGYLAGFGVMLAAVSGLRAGEAAARHVLD